MPSFKKLLPEKSEFEINHAIRSIPTANPTKSLFYESDLTETEQAFAAALADQSSGIDHESDKRNRWYEYGDLEKTEFCFDQVVIPESRFTDGSFPVWYGASSHEASKAEVIFHLNRQAQKELEHCTSESSVRFERAVCKATIKLSAAADIRPTVEESMLFEDGPPYPNSNAFSKTTMEEGYTGIVTKSRRFKNADCYAAFRKTEILKSKVICFWDVQISADEIKVCNDEVFKITDGWVESVE